ncbi:MAG: hypothetical protein P8Z49_08320, partial [Acidobacteriota bacterium]
MFAFAGCAGLFGNNKVQHSSSLVDYLYPGKRQKVKPSIPHLDLPLSVGLAFVPANTRDLQFNEKAKMDLMEYPVVPVVKELTSDTVTPFTVYSRLAARGRNPFLLESVE